MESADLLEIRTLLRPYGLDLGSYTDSFLQRRILIRMRQHQLKTMTEYRVLLSRDMDERRRLTELLSVTVTEFFRDEMFTDQVLNPLFAKMLAKAGKRTIHAWSAGCATGQEPYSMAFLLDSFLTPRRQPADFKIYASDISEANLKVAAAGTYPKTILATIPDKYKKYFAESGDKTTVSAAIRSLIEFKRHDLCDTPPFSGLDLIFCRNVMIYLTPEAKTIILKRFHAALLPGAYLVLGAAEIILEPTLFKSLDNKHKIYEKV